MYNLVWNTRWVDNNRTEIPPELWDALDQFNQPHGTGAAISMWGNHLLDSLVSTSGSSPPLVIYAGTKGSTNEFNIWIINKDYIRRDVQIRVKGFSKSFRFTSGQQLSGSDANGVSYSLTDVNAGPVVNGTTISCAIQPLSVTVLKFAPS